MWILMSRKEQNSYVKVWNKIKELFPDFHPQSAMSDFETAIQNSLEECFAGIIIRHCWFHFTQVNFHSLHYLHEKCSSLLFF